jgi:pyrroloquinoline quinone biosynthesis protein D
MTGRAQAQLGSAPALGAHMRLRFDTARTTWSIQAPERAFLLDGIAHDIVSRCDGRRTVAMLVDDLCLAHCDASREQITADVLQLIQAFLDKGVMEQ